MAAKLRIALNLELNWPLKRHIGIFEGTQRYAAQCPDWECVIDEFVEDTIRRSHRGSPPYDGVIARANRKLAGLARARRMPIVNVWMNSPAKGLPSVFPDMAEAGVLCAEHLLARGFRRFVSIVRSDIGEAAQARRFARCVTEAGFSCDSLKLRQIHLYTRAAWHGVEREVRQWMDLWVPPVAVYAGSEELGRLIAQHCRLRQLRIPLDVAIIAGSNDEILCEHPPPRLSSVEYGYSRIGFQAAKLLDELIREGMPRGGVEPIHVKPVGIVSRESTDFFAVEDAQVAAALRYIGERCNEPINVNDVAAAVHVSRPTLERRFRLHLGRPIAAEIRRLRLERAKREIIDTEEPLKIIARQVGFASEATMNAVFRRVMGVSPGEYRSNALKEQGAPEGQ